MRLRANRPLTGSYGYAGEGQLFETDEQTANQLMAAGLAEPAVDDKALAKAHHYETKVVTPDPKHQPAEESDEPKVTIRKTQRLPQK